VDQRPFDTENRAHFLAVASRLMWQILVDYASSHGAAKRGKVLGISASTVKRDWNVAKAWLTREMK
jgi:hypothetical protein